jgi:predicted phosphoribosyltransferase
MTPPGVVEMTPKVFPNRRAAGRQLARLLQTRAAGRPHVDTVVIGLPRGGVPVAHEIALGLDAPLDALVVRKLGTPVCREMAMGALAEGGVRYLDDRIMRQAGVTAEQLASIEAFEQSLLDRRAAMYRTGRRPLSLTGRAAVVVDDGMATGATAIAACRAAYVRGAVHVTLAVPVASPQAVYALRAEVDDVVVLEVPRSLRSVGQWYDDFSQVDDAEVLACLADRATRSVDVD